MRRQRRAAGAQRRARRAGDRDVLAGKCGRSGGQPPGAGGRRARSPGAGGGLPARRWASAGKVDFLVNGAGGNDPRATTTPDARFFDVPLAAWQAVTNLNLLGTILPSQVFARPMAERKEGVILNVSSVNASRPLTRIAAYSASKAGISNFTQWLAVHLAQEYSPTIRVNALMPGFFLTEQNRFLLTDKETGALTARGKKILEHTPMARFGTPEDLTGALLWLLSPASSVRHRRGPPGRRRLHRLLGGLTSR